MPLDELVAALNEKAARGVARIDQPLPAGLAESVMAGGALRATNDLYYELTL